MLPPPFPSLRPHHPPLGADPPQGGHLCGLEKEAGFGQARVRGRRAGRQVGFAGGSEAGATLTRQLAGAQGLGVPAGARPQPGPSPIGLETSAPLPLRLPGEL